MRAGMPSMRGVAAGALACALALVAPGAGRGSGASELRQALPVRGIVRPLQQAAISTDLPARVARLHFREAQAFRKGDALVTFDCERLAAEHAAAAAVQREAQLLLDSNTYLDKRGAVGRVDVEVSRARADKAAAEARALSARLEQCVIRAPFDGRVAELRINEHEIPASGQPFLSIVGLAEFEIDLIVPSWWLGSLAVGTPLAFTVDETGRTLEARVLRIGAAVDPVSQTVKLIAGFAAHDDSVLPGMSGTAAFPGRGGLR